MPEEKDFYKDLIDNLYDGVYFVDRDRVINYWNKGAERITGYSAEKVIGRSCRDNLLNHVTSNGFQLCQSHCPLAATMEDGKVREADVFLHHADGHRVPVLIRASPLRDEEGNIVGAVETFSSELASSAVRQQLRELRHTVRTDPLTGLGNRPYLEGRLRALVAEFEKQTGSAAVVFMDIDRFKQVNDTYGHPVGDKVLQIVASTLKYALRETDVLGRWGGEEFLAILYDVTSETALEAICEKLRSLVECSQLFHQDQVLTATISIGATLLKPSDTADTIFERADRMLYRSKQAGRNRVTVE